MHSWFIIVDGFSRATGGHARRHARACSSCFQIWNHISTGSSFRDEDPPGKVHNSRTRRRDRHCRHATSSDQGPRAHTGDQTGHWRTFGCDSHQDSCQSDRLCWCAGRIDQTEEEEKTLTSFVVVVVLIIRCPSDILTRTPFGQPFRFLVVDRSVKRDAVRIDPDRSGVVAGPDLGTLAALEGFEQPIHPACGGCNVQKTPIKSERHPNVFASWFEFPRPSLESYFSHSYGTAATMALMIRGRWTVQHGNLKKLD